MLAEHLLDSNFSRADGSSEYRDHLQHNLSDAISLLPKLTTGIDVNVRFDGVRSLEYTGEIAVFDLLGIDLVHGWLYDPQDTNTAVAISNRSYNDLVIQIVSALGGDATPSALSRRSTAPGGIGINVGAAGRGATPSAAGTQPKIDAEALSAALQSTLRVTIPEHPPTPGAGDLQTRSTAGSTVSQDSVTSVINKMLGETVKVRNMRGYGVEEVSKDIVQISKSFDAVFFSFGGMVDVCFSINCLIIFNFLFNFYCGS